MSCWFGVARLVNFHHPHFALDIVIIKGTSNLFSLVVFEYVVIYFCFKKVQDSFFAIACRLFHRLRNVTNWPIVLFLPTIFCYWSPFYHFPFLNSSILTVMGVQFLGFGVDFHDHLHFLVLQSTFLNTGAENYF